MNEQDKNKQNKTTIGTVDISMEVSDCTRNIFKYLASISSTGHVILRSESARFIAVPSKKAEAAYVDMSVSNFDTFSFDGNKVMFHVSFAEIHAKLSRIQRGEGRVEMRFFNVPTVEYASEFRGDKVNVLLKRKDEIFILKEPKEVECEEIEKFELYPNTLKKFLLASVSVKVDVMKSLIDDMAKVTNAISFKLLEKNKKVKISADKIELEDFNRIITNDSGNAVSSIGNDEDFESVYDINMIKKDEVLMGHAKKVNVFFGKLSPAKIEMFLRENMTRTSTLSGSDSKSEKIIKTRHYICPFDD